MIINFLSQEYLWKGAFPEWI